jgi:hypothetical protein
VPQDAAQRATRAAIAAAALQPPLPGRQRERRRVKGMATLTVLVVAVLGIAGYEFAANAGHVPSATAAAHPSAQHPAAGASASSPAAASTAPASPSPASPSPSTSVSASSPPRVLAPASVTAFGPAGSADGQNPHNVALAVAGHPATPWYSYVSATPGLPGRASGTGLLLDMGRTVTVTSVQVSMVGPRGAALQLRAGAKPLLSSLREVASVSGAGGTALLQPATSAKARYVLVWFTRLPPDRLGTYQANVYRIVVHGQS